MFLIAACETTSGIDIANIIIAILVPFASGFVVWQLGKNDQDRRTITEFLTKVSNDSFALLRAGLAKQWHSEAVEIAKGLGDTDIHNQYRLQLVHSDLAASIEYSEAQANLFADGMLAELLLDTNGKSLRQAIDRYANTASTPDPVEKEALEYEGEISKEILKVWQQYRPRGWMGFVSNRMRERPGQ